MPGLSFAVSLHPNAAGWCESLYFSARFHGGGRARARAGLQECGLTPAELMSAGGHSSVSVGRPKETDPGAQEGFFSPTRTFTDRLEAALGRKNRLAPSHSLLPGAATWVWGPGRPLLPSPGLRLSGVELVLFFPARPVSACVGAVGRPFPFLLGPCREPFLFLSASSASLFQFSFCTGLPALLMAAQAHAWLGGRAMETSSPACWRQASFKPPFCLLFLSFSPN